MLEVPPGSVALVTGASSGIGEALARKLAERGIPLVLAARSADRLSALAEELRARHGVSAETFPVDLSEAGAVSALLAVTEGAGKPVDLLVSCAGFGLNGRADELPVDRTLEMLRLNVMASTELAVACLSAMRARRRGRILNVASTQAFLPMPYMAAYGASKAYLLSFSHALHEEARGDGVTVTALCPGYTKTGFYGASGMRGPEGTPFPEMRADDVAEIGLQALERGKPLIVPHPLDRLWILAGRFVPRWVPARAAARIFSKSHAG